MRSIQARLERLERETEGNGTVHVFSVHQDREYSHDDLIQLAKDAGQTMDPKTDDVVLLMTFYEQPDTETAEPSIPDRWLSSFPGQLNRKAR